MFFIEDVLYKMGLYKNELADYVLESKENCKSFLNDVFILEEKSINPPKLELPSLKQTAIFEKNIEALVRVLEKKKK